MSSDQIKAEFEKLNQRIKELEATVRYMKRKMRK